VALVAAFCLRHKPQLNLVHLLEQGRHVRTQSTRTPSASPARTSRPVAPSLDPSEEASSSGLLGCPPIISDGWPLAGTSASGMA